jgi:uncharacterized membrane protein (GlpM family)
MTPTFDLQKLRTRKFGALALRFGFGGAITVATQLVARAFGPEVAGLFLAFPAILPASLTLIRDDDGPAAAVNDALGAMAGSVALLVFAASVWEAAGAIPVTQLLCISTIAWIVSGVGLWKLFLSRVPDG